MTVEGTWLVIDEVRPRRWLMLKLVSGVIPMTNPSTLLGKVAEALYVRLFSV